VVGSSSETCQEMDDATAPDHPDGLVEQLLNGTVLRLDRIEACRRWVTDGPQPDASDVADALVAHARPPTA